VPEQKLTTEAILEKLSKELLNGNQVCDILNNPIEFPTRLIEEISLATALKYWKGEMDYFDGDCIMTNLFGFWVTDERYFKNRDFPDIAWECYEAFDSGQFVREHDDNSIVPSEKYTRPLVESLLRRRQLIM
jgi:hypothetical protein